MKISALVVAAQKNTSRSRLGHTQAQAHAGAWQAFTFTVLSDAASADFTAAADSCSRA